ncbi:MAG TPA: alpha/beta hydrolase [Gemmatimonadaceae bacterium]|nr:alpha/beta hydrolase [Gemmatimonadaceae bacterium]
MSESSTIPIKPVFVKVDGLEIRYATSPKIGTPTVLMTGPWPESIFSYLPIWETLALEFSLIAIDLPGFGQSEGRADLMSPHAMGDFVMEIASALDVDRFHAIGPDIGSPTLLFTASHYPEAVQSLVIGSGASVFPMQIDGILKSMVEAPNLDEFRKLDPAQVVLGAASSVKNYDMPQTLKDDFVASYAGDRLWDSMALVRQYPTDLPILKPLLAAMKTPVQIIVGKDDPYGLAKDAELLHAQLENSALSVLPGGHSVWMEQASEYARIASAWIGGGYAKLTPSVSATAGAPSP